MMIQVNHPIDQPPRSNHIVTNSSIECLRLLQDQLKRQYLLLQRQQRQKSRIKKQIQKFIQEYYSVLVEKSSTSNPNLNKKVVTQDKLNNSYNFVKDVVLSISKDVRAGFEVLMLCPEEVAEELSELLLGMFYENFNESDPYLKKNTNFAEILGKKICEEVLEENFMKKGDSVNLKLGILSKMLRLLLKQFCKLQSVKQYFEMLANRVLNKIPHSLRFANSLSRGSFSGQVQPVSFIQVNPLTQSQSITLNRSTTFFGSSEIDMKIDQAVQEYKNDILGKAEMMPVCLRVLCYSITNQLLATKRIKTVAINQFLWEILEIPYFAPFSNDGRSHKWNHFKNTYFTNTVTRIQETMNKKADNNFLQKLMQKIININKEKIVKKEQEVKKKIVINGGCVSYMNLYNLFKVIKSNDKILKPFNQRITNRVGKINEMNPNFDFFRKFQNAQTSYLVFTQLIYSETLQKDYQATYTSIYNEHKIKNMLKQILADNTFHIMPYIQRQKFLRDVLSKIIKQQEIEGEGNFSLGALQHSQQFIMKIKFLVFLMEKEKINEEEIFCEMIEECVKRQRNNIEMFQQNKVLLLQCLTTVSKAKKIVKAQKQAEKNIDHHLKIVKILDTMQISLCITGPSTRSEKQKYTKTGSRGILVQNSNTCLHQQNIEQGLKHHASNVQDALSIFCQLREVKQTMENGKDVYHVYDSLSKILEYLKDTCRKQFMINMEEYMHFQGSIFKVVMREIHEILLENKEKSAMEIQFQKQLKALAFIKPSKIKLPGRDNLAELQQVWQIACRYLKNLNEKKSPNQKIQSIMQMIQVIKISLRRQKEKEKQKGDKNEKEQTFDKHSAQIVLAYCLIRSKPEKILSNINYIEIFLSKDRLLSRQGGALQRLKMAVSMIQQKKITQFIISQNQDFQQELLKSQTVNQVTNMRQNQKVTSLIGYI